MKKVAVVFAISAAAYVTIKVTYNIGKICGYLELTDGVIGRDATKQAVLNAIDRIIENLKKGP